MQKVHTLCRKYVKFIKTTRYCWSDATPADPCMQHVSRSRLRSREKNRRLRSWSRSRLKMARLRNPGDRRQLYLFHTYIFFPFFRLKDIDATFAKKFDHYLEYGKDSPDKVRYLCAVLHGHGTSPNNTQIAKQKGRYRYLPCMLVRYLNKTRYRNSGNTFLINFMNTGTYVLRIYQTFFSIVQLLTTILAFFFR